MTINEYAESRGISPKTVYMWIYQHGIETLEGHISKQKLQEGKKPVYVLDDEAARIMDKIRNMSPKERAHKINSVNKPFEETQLGKLVRILVINGECRRKDLTELLGGIGANTSKLLYRNSKAFVTIVPDVYLKNARKKKEEKVLVRMTGNVIRPKFDSGTTEGSQFKNLVYKLDETGRAWEYFDSHILRSGTLRPRDRTMIRNTYISRVLMRLMETYNIDYWSRPTLSELAGSNEIPVNTFFSISEVKGFKQDGTLEHANSVATGVLATPNGVFTTYCMNQEPDKSTWKDDKASDQEDSTSEQPWRLGMETRIQVLTSKIFRGAKYPYIDERMYADKKSDIMIFGNMDIALSIFKGFYSPSSKSAIQMPKSVGKVCFIPDDPISREPLKLLSIPNMHDTICDYVFKGRKRFNSVTEDAEMDGRAVLLWLDNDLQRLSMALQKTDRRVKELLIICLESQAPLVENLAKVFRNDEIVPYISTVRFDDILAQAERTVREVD